MPVTPAGRLFTYIDVPAQGVEVRLTVAALAPITVAREDASGGLPAIPDMVVAPRSVAQTPAMIPGFPDPTVVRRTVTIGPPTDKGDREGGH